MSKEIPLEDVFERYCEYTYCQYNNYEYCSCDDCISEFMTYKKDDNFATCNRFKVKDGYCETCGNELKKYTDYYPYGDTEFPYEYWQCPNC